MFCGAAISGFMVRIGASAPVAEVAMTIMIKARLAKRAC
jgi:hypothetical protein